MVVVMTADATAADVDYVVAVVRDAGGEAFVSRGESRTIIGLSGDIERFTATLNLASLPGVADVVRISVPYKLVSREHRRQRSVIRVAGVPIGPDTLTVIAGPCAVETPEQTLAAAEMARAAGASLLRGGAFKPRYLAVRLPGARRSGTEASSPRSARRPGCRSSPRSSTQRDVELVSKYADMLQVGTRNMQNFPLLQAVGAAGKPVMLKRGMSATIEEWLMAAEYIVAARQPGHRAVRARHPHLRDGHAQHPGHLGGAGRAAAVAPAGDRGPVALRRPPRPGAAAVPRGDRGRGGRHHRRRPPASGERAVRWTAGAHRVRPAGAGQRRRSTCRRWWDGRSPPRWLVARWQKPPSYRASSQRISPGGRPPVPRCEALHASRAAGRYPEAATPAYIPGRWRPVARRVPPRRGGPRSCAGRRSWPGSRRAAA